MRKTALLVILLVLLGCTSQGVQEAPNLITHPDESIVRSMRTDMDARGVPYRLVAIAQHEDIFIAQFQTALNEVWQYVWQWDGEYWNRLNISCIYGCTEPEPTGVPSLRGIQA